MNLSALWRAFNDAYDAHPGDPLHPSRVAARENLWRFCHPDWVCTPVIMETPF